MPVVRDAGRWAATSLPGEPHLAELGDAAALRTALADATHIISCAHARHAPAILTATPPDATLVFLGSTRKFTRWPDDHARGVLAGEAAFLASGRRGVVLHPTMIYGAQGEDNVQRLAKLLRWLPVVPLPDGGRALVQPIHQDDVTRCIRAALRLDWHVARSMVIAGPAALAYRDFLRKVARASGLRPRPVLTVPSALLGMAARAGAAFPFLPRITPAEIRRLGEDKSADISAMRSLLGVTPIDLDAGLSLVPWQA